MSKTIDTYLDQLRTALAGSDPALIQDALYDAREHLEAELQVALAGNPGTDPEEVVLPLVDKYGSPAEIAEAYRQAEDRLLPASRPPVQAPPASLTRRFFGVLADGRAWASLVYMLLSLGLGVAYFTWAITGLSLSLGLIVLIIGIPFIGLFLASVKGLSLIEGRVVEALLGIRMPHRPILDQKKKGWLAQLKAWLVDGHTWTTLGYLLLMLPLGILYFTLAVTLVSVSLALIAAPIVYLAVGSQAVQLEWPGYYVPEWVVYVLPLLGALGAVLTMHLARGIGRLHASFAKFMLVKV